MSIVVPDQRPSFRISSTAERIPPAIQAAASMASSDSGQCCPPIVPVTSPVLDNMAVPEDCLNLQDAPSSVRAIRSTAQPSEPPKGRLPIAEPIHSEYPPLTNTLAPAQREKLHSISVTPDLQYQTEHSSQSASSNYNSCLISSLDNTDNSRKRKASEDDNDNDSRHGITQKRYRAKLKDEFAALRNSVPSLCVVTKSARGEYTARDREDLHGLTVAHKLNKATVLEKATEYIYHLEKRNTRLTDEKTAVEARIVAFEKFFMAGLSGTNLMPPTNPQPNVQAPYPMSPNNSHTATHVSPEGMIDIPDDSRRLRATNQIIQQTYQTPQEQHEPTSRVLIGPNEWQDGGGYFRNIMVASLAGLLILESFTEADQDGSAPNAHGLFAFLSQILRGMGRYVRSLSDISVLGYHSSASQTLALLKVMLAFGTLLSLYIPSFLETGPNEKDFRTLSPQVAAAPPLALSSQVRRQAWLTAIQTVWAPSHNFFREVVALCLKMIELNIRNVIGWYGYTLLTGITEQQEAARVKAWEIALDAQLTGGDVEVSKSRLVLTLIASCTIPDTPVRLMLKALHIRVLLWDIGNGGINRFYMFQEIAAKLARSKWNEAKYLQVLLSHPHVRSSEQEYEPLPEHVATLLEQECDDVLVHSIGQRAYNLTWNLPTTHNAVGPSDGMDDVVDDHAIRSPLDAVAAWRSSLILQTALANSLASDEESIASDIGIDKGIERDINLAIKTAPVGSRAQLRALVARAVVFDEKRGANIVRALQALAPFEPQDVDPTSIGTTLITTSTSITCLPDLKMSLDCATAVAHLERSPSSATPTSAFSTNDIRPTDLGLLGFVAAFKLMETLLDHKVACVNCSHILDNLASTLRIWIGGAEGHKSGLRRGTRERVVEKCISIKTKMIGMEKVAGNETVNEEEIEEEC